MNRSLYPSVGHVHVGDTVASKEPSASTAIDSLTQDASYLVMQADAVNDRLARLAARLMGGVPTEGKEPGEGEPGMSPTTHSSFSASASARLLACPGSYALALKVDEENGHVRRSSIFAAEGTLAHALSEACLLAGTDPASFLGDTRAADGFTFKVDEEMVEAVKLYVEYVRGLRLMGYEVTLETQVSPSGLWDGLTPLDVDLFGTSDTIAYNAQTRDLRIVDLKYGRGVPVEAKDNSQLHYYAAGSLAHFKPGGLAVDTVTMTIIQPRAPHPEGPIRWHTRPASELVDWARTTLYEGVKQALSDNGQTLNAGKHCRFCPVAPHCEAARDLSINTARMAFAATAPTNLPASAPATSALPQITLSDAALGDLLNKIEIIGPWLESVKKTALERLEAGSAVPGWKLVPKQARRKWADDELDEMLAAFGKDANIKPADVDKVTTRTLLSPAQAEKALGRKRFAEVMAPYVIKNFSGMTLAPEVDPRSVAARRTAQEAFGLTSAGVSTSKNT